MKMEKLEWLTRLQRVTDRVAYMATHSPVMFSTESRGAVLFMFIPNNITAKMIMATSR